MEKQNLNEKTAALLAVARAYYDRGAFVQYDQRSMDRLLELTPRRRKRLPPEAANSQYTQFLDCSGFVSAVYLETFGYELPSDLTWHMVDLLEPQIYYYELTHKETDAEMAKIEAEVRALLQPGDLIVYQRYTGSGHVVMYIGEDRYTDSTIPKGQKDSYDYTEHKNNYYERGTWIKSVDLLFEKDEANEKKRSSLFCQDTKRFAISRPIERLGEPRPEALARIRDAKGLWCAVENSAPGCSMVQPGEVVTYTLLVRNKNQEAKTVIVELEAPDDCELQSAGKTIVRELAAGEELREKFGIRVFSRDTRTILDGPKVMVNGLPIFAHRVLVGSLLTDSEITNINNEILTSITHETSALSAAASAYHEIGIPMESDEKQYLYSHFFLHDSTKGDVLSRRPQDPKKDLALYSAFGGRGVITPEMGSLQVGPRATQLVRRDLRAGDLILCFDDALGRETSSYYYTGEQLLGVVKDTEKTEVIYGKELEQFIDGLFGQFAFLVLRPSVAK